MSWWCSCAASSSSTVLRCRSISRPSSLRPVSSNTTAWPMPHGRSPSKEKLSSEPRCPFAVAKTFPSTISILSGVTLLPNFHHWKTRFLLPLSPVPQFETCRFLTLHYRSLSSLFIILFNPKLIKFDTRYYQPPAYPQTGQVLPVSVRTLQGPNGTGHFFERSIVPSLQMRQARCHFTSPTSAADSKSVGVYAVQPDPKRQVSSADFCNCTVSSWNFSDSLMPFHGFEPYELFEMKRLIQYSSNR